MASFWLMSGGMVFMTFTLTFAGTVQTHLQRVMGMNYMDVQDQLWLFYCHALRFGRGSRAGRAPLHLCDPGPAARGHRTWSTCARPRRRSEACTEHPKHEGGGHRPLLPAPGRRVRSLRGGPRNGLPLLLKGPTGCGKTRFVAHMAARLGRPLYTVACHDDLSAADLIGRYLLKGGETVWVDGPLTRAVRDGAICYLDEVVEARKDVTVVLHPLTDDRRILPIDRTGEELEAGAGFMLVASYNPGYQNILKTLKPSTRQRFVALEFDFPAVPSMKSGGGARKRPLRRSRQTVGAACKQAAGAERAGS
jgi:nitric oxide reductase NorQ protein